MSVTVSGESAGKVEITSHNDCPGVYLLFGRKPPWRLVFASALLQGERSLSRLAEPGEKFLPLRVVGLWMADLVASEENPGIFSSASLDLSLRSLLLLSGLLLRSLLLLEARDPERCLWRRGS